MVDFTWASQPIAASFFAAGVHLIGYTGDVLAVERVFPGCVVIANDFAPADDEPDPLAQ